MVNKTKEEQAASAGFARPKDCLTIIYSPIKIK